MSVVPYPLYLHALSDKEISLLKLIVRAAIRDKNKLLKQADFVGDGGDVRNFIRLEEPNNPETEQESGEASEEIDIESMRNTQEKKSHRARSNPVFIANLYNIVMGELYKKLRSEKIATGLSPSHSQILEMIDELFGIGLTSGRYNRDMNIYMDKMLNGNMYSQIVNDDDRGFYVGYRYSTDGRDMLRFFIHVYYDAEISRTLFRIIMSLGWQVRDTKGFAYNSGGNTFLSGFINDGIGCEFITFRNAATRMIRAGLVVTTSANGAPAAKQCLLVRANNTKEYAKFAKSDVDELLSEEDWKIISAEMVPIPGGTGWEKDIGEEVIAKVNRLEQFVSADEIIRVGARRHSTRYAVNA